jgi:predicted NAD-dependent protein-ADP-ribosyltransferase YbiA (DUF1768 family)
MTTKQNIIAFVRQFKDEVLIPCAQEGILDEAMLDESAEVYVDELLEQEAAARVVSVTKDGEWRDLHPFAANPFEVEGQKYASVTHFRYASFYFKADEDCFNYILEARTPEIAHRRGEEMGNLGRTKREDWEYSQKDNLKKAYKAILMANKPLLEKLCATSSGIEFVNTTDAVLGAGADGKGKNLLPLILKELRKELK